MPALYTELRQPRFDSLNAESKYQLVTQLAERLLRRPASAGLALVSVLGWLAIMVLPLGIIRYAPVSGDEQAMAKAEAERGQQVATWTAKIAAAATPQDEVRLRLAAARRALQATSSSARRSTPARAVAVAAAEARRPRARGVGAAAAGSPRADDARRREPGPEAVARAKRHLGRALDLREQRFGVESREVAEVLEALPDHDPSDRVGALVRELRLIGIYERELPERPDGRWPLVRAHEREARLRDAGGDRERAESALQRALDVAEAAPAGDRESMRSEVQSQLASLRTSGR